MKSVVHIIPSLRKGGAERLTVDVCNYLSENSSLKVYLITLFSNDPNTTFRNEVSAQVNLIELGKGKGFSWRIFNKLNRTLKEINPDAVHTHINAFEYVFPYRVGNKKVKFFHTIHSKAEKECPNPFIKSQRRYFFSRNTQAITISSDGSKTYREYYNLFNDVIIQNGRAAITLSPDPDQFLKIRKKYEGQYLFVHLGRIIKVKNQELMIKAVKLFNQTNIQKIHLLILGGVRDESLYHHLNALVQQDGNDDISFLGDISNIGDYLYAADAFCLSSAHEGMPMSVIEALSAGCPPIATPVGGIPDMIEDGVSGFLSKDMTVESYKNAIDRCLNFDDRSVLKENCKIEFKKKYDISLCCNKYLDLYRTAKTN